jgi:hypothetical protein
MIRELRAPGARRATALIRAKCNGHGGCGENRGNHATFREYTIMLISNSTASNTYSVNTEPASGGAGPAVAEVARDPTAAGNGFQVLRGGGSGGGVTTDLDLVGLASAIWDAIAEAAAKQKQMQQEHWNRS